MSLGLLNNIASIYAQNHLNQTQASLQTTLNQLASGSRINSGADDAAGLAVANGLHANVAALNQSTANVNDGIGLLQTADGALSQVTNLLNRAVTLATEASNGTLNSNQVSAANQEYQNILTEIGNIGATTNYNGNSVFTATAKTVFVSDGTSGGSTSFSETVGTLSAAGIGVAPPTPTVTTLSVPTASTPTSGAGAVAKFAAPPTGATIGGTISLAYAGAAAASYTVSAGSTVASAVSQLNTQFTAASVGVTASVGTGADAGKLILTGTAGTSNTIDLTGSVLQQSVPSTTNGPGANFTSTGSPNVSTLNQATASTVLTTVTSAIADVAYQRGILGASINQLSAAQNVASTQAVNLTSAENSVTATNYGQAASDLAKYQVLSQTGISALAQANAVQQEVLKLVQ